jgi:CheY-like chemotaxis protein
MIVRQSSFQLDARVHASKFTVLVADDCAANRRLFEVLFSSCGCSVSLVEDGAEALSAALSQHFDLICLDRHMPNASGDEVAEAVRSAYGRAPRPFLVLSTSDPRPGDVPYAFDAVLPKPFTPHDVATVVAKALHSAISGKGRSGRIGRPGGGSAAPAALGG